MVGLEPPYESESQEALSFVRHALSFRPRLLVLIVPPSVLEELSSEQYYILEKIDSPAACTGGEEMLLTIAVHPEAKEECLKIQQQTSRQADLLL